MGRLSETGTGLFVRETRPKVGVVGVPVVAWQPTALLRIRTNARDRSPTLYACTD